MPDRACWLPALTTIIMSTRSAAGPIPPPAEHQNTEIECAYLCIMAWRSRSAAPDEVLPLALVILGDLR
jgi:hypothetical protein